MNKSEIKPYVRKAQYHETDQMGIIHHSNYVKWMEEARIDFLNQIGVNYGYLEEMGLVSPIVEVKCQYKGMVRFGDSVSISINVQKYTGVKLVLSYNISNIASGELCTICETSSCFITRDGKLISLKREFPELHDLLSNYA